MMIPKQVMALFDEQELVAVATSDAEGGPNVVPIYWKKIIDHETIIFIDRFMKRTRENIIRNEKMCVSFWDPKTEEAYKLKGICKYHTGGSVFEKGKVLLQAKNPGMLPKGVIEFKVNQVFSISPGKKAGEKV